MTKHSRRDFIKQLGAFAVAALAGQGAFARTFFSENVGAFDFLVVGDSLIWGQGLQEEHKFYQLTKEWLETDIFKNSRPVNLKVKAHSGASLNLRQDEIDALLKAEIGEDKTYHPEVNLSFPSVRSQIDAAVKEYDAPESVNLIMLTGGITDIRLSVILNPLESNDELKQNIVRHCNEEMSGLLEYAADKFPNALIAVVGYYPFLSPHTPAKKIFNGVLEIYNFPRALKFLINNPLNRRTLRYYRKKMIKRSQIWAEDSTREFKKAIEKVNAGFEIPRAIFIESPIKEENSIGAKKSLLYEIEKRGKVADSLAAERKTICRETLDGLREATGLKLRTRTCELATVGHPNIEGSRAYAEAIRNALKPFIV